MTNSETWTMLSKTLQQLSITDPGTFCEFGVNKFITLPLVEKDWKGVYIADGYQYDQLRKIAQENYPCITVINAEVREKGINNLYNLLATTNLLLDFDILSMDIKNYNIWKAFKNYCPRIVSVQYTPQQVQLCPDMINLATSKGYELLSDSGIMVFVQK